MRRHILFVMATIFLVARTAIAAGTLCLAANEQEPVCTNESELASVRLEPAPLERRAVWIDSDYGTTVVFNVAPHQRQAAVAGGGEIPYRIRSERLSHGVRTIELSLVDQRGQAWKWTLPGRAASGRILAPAGVYTLNVTVSGARSESVSQIRVEQAGKPNVATIDLFPKAVATGIVVDEAGAPIAGATISGPGDVVLGASALDGRFAVDDGSARLPEHLTIHAERYASRTIPITDRYAAFEAGTIQLVRGTTVALRVRMAEEGQHGLRDAKASLHRLERRRPLVSRQPLSPESSVTFTHVPPGKYVMLIEGSGPLERYGEIVEVKTEPLFREVVISPAELTGHVYFGAEALAGATVTLAPKRQEWTVNLTTGEDGQFGGVVWQSGLFSAIVEGGALPSPYIDDKDLALSRTWDIIVPDRRIFGAIVDEKSGKGVAGARITYESAGARMRLSSIATADSSGRYEIVGVPEGTIRIRATAPGYLPSEPSDVQIEPTQQSRELQIALSAGSLVKVQVRNEQGGPLSGALVFDDFAGQLNPTRYVTDGRGEVSIPLQHGTTKLFYIVPRDGSFALARLAAGDQPREITVPGRTGSLMIHARDDAGTPIGALRFLVAYNGEILPEAFWTVMSHTQNLDFITDAGGVLRHSRLPAGTYEVWPYRSDAEGRAIARNTGAVPPAARVVVRPADEQVVRLTFAKRSRV